MRARGLENGHQQREQDGGTCACWSVKCVCGMSLKVINKIESIDCELICWFSNTNATWIGYDFNHSYCPVAIIIKHSKCFNELNFKFDSCATICLYGSSMECINFNQKHTIG